MRQPPPISDCLRYPATFGVAVTLSVKVAGVLLIFSLLVIPAVAATMSLGDGVSLHVRQETEYPNSGRVVLHLDPSKPAKFPLQLRIPRWCNEAVAAVNGQPIDAPIVPGEFLTIDLAGRAPPIVFRREESLKATEDILSDEGIRRQFSDDLETVWHPHK